ncbi:MAG: hypothetical protein ACYC92_07810 [Candidatus Acidiferrales bacterium]
MEKRQVVSNFSRETILNAGVAALLALAVVAAAWAGGPPWKTKPFEQWNQNDVRQILHDSPWAKVQYVPQEWKMSPGGGGAPGMSRAPAGTAAAAEGPAEGAEGAEGVGEEPMGTPEGETAYYVRWNSSRTVREALVRDGILSGKIKEADAPKYLAAPITDYEVVVIGPDMTPFGSTSEDELKAKAYLRGKQSKVKVGATSVQTYRGSGGDRVTAVMFSFPRKTADGKDVAAPQEKGLQFVCNIKNLNLNTTFDPRKMADAKGPDF